MKNFRIPSWLLGFALFYVILQVITLELPQRDERDVMPRLFSQGGIDDIVLQNKLLYDVDLNRYNMPHEDTTKQESVVCLAKNAYFEARNQSVLSQIAVSQVVMNRVESPDYPNTVCGVVYEAQLSKWYKENMDKEVPLKHKCQFSWYCDGKADIITDVDAQKAWEEVHGCNMSKERGIKESRPNPLGLPDLIKPEGWKGPNHDDNTGYLANAV